MNRARNVEPIPDMSTDNTEVTIPGTALGEDAANQVINQVQEGMRVVDATGEELGNVEYIKMGDPGAATVSSATQTDPGLIQALLGTGEPDVPEPLRSRLLRFGFVKIDGKGWIDTDRYVTADLIGRVSGDTVSLTVDKDHILTEM